MLTYQDYEAAADKEAFISKAIDEYISSDLYKFAKVADKYYDGENMIMDVKSHHISIGETNIDLAAIRTPSAIFKRLIIQMVQTLWAYGVQLKDENLKDMLGSDFDYTASSISENSALHSVCFGFWNLDKIQMFTARECFVLKDERTSKEMVAIRFWQLDDTRPMYVQLYELNGWTEFKKVGNDLTLILEKQPYRKSVTEYNAMPPTIEPLDGYETLPVIPLYANKRHTSELSTPIKNKIDLMDFILSGFGDSVLRTKIIYWVLQGFGGTLDDFKKMRNEINESGIIAPVGDEVGADAKVVDLPFGAVSYALDKLEAGIYLDFMGLRLSEISGGSLTNVAIETAQENLTLKVSDFEWQNFDFVRRILALQGIKTEDIKFKRRGIANKTEIMTMLMMCRADLDLQTALEKNPLVEPDEVQVIMDRLAAEQLGMGDDVPPDDETIEVEKVEENI